MVLDKRLHGRDRILQISHRRALLVAVICLGQNREKLVGLGRLLEQLGHGFGRFGQFWLVLARAHV